MIVTLFENNFSGIAKMGAYSNGEPFFIAKIKNIN